MEQLVQKLGSGEMSIQEVPAPVCGPGILLIRNHYSVISAGTEGSTVKGARQNWVSKAQGRPDEVKKVIALLRRQGPVQTFRAVMKRLDAYSPLGYSSAGIVIEVGEGTNDWAVGDRVACAGAGYANHAELVAVPSKLCVKLPDAADLKLAAYNTLGAIALQGIRQADLRLGESCAVIGLGLLGHLTVLMLTAAGIRAYGIDVDPHAVTLVRENATPDAWLRNEPALVERIYALTNGLGVDGVIITAASSSLDPVNLAGEISRKKGRIVVIGAVPVGFDREPFYYRKELELRMSCSYGPGRYDPAYEVQGVDYPAAYVRWTENRNMQAFQHLVHTGRIDIRYLSTHEFALADAAKAYDMIVNRTEPYLGVVLNYEPTHPVSRNAVAICCTAPPCPTLGLAFVGAGSYAQSYLLPNLPKQSSTIARRVVLTSTGITSKRVAERYQFEMCTSNEADVFENTAVNTIFVATRHDSHATYVQKGLTAGKHVFVEKPLAINRSALEQINALCRGGTQDGTTSREPLRRPLLMVGYNRRFSPVATELKEHLSNAPLSMLYRINAGSVSRDSWVHDPLIGGGRIIGEVCHFVDLLSFLCGSLPSLVYAADMGPSSTLGDTVSITITFANGSIGAISYLSNGASSLEKEYLEVHSAGTTGIIRDFRYLEILRDRRLVRRKRWTQDKGQSAMVKAFLDAVLAGHQSPIPFEALYKVSLTTFAIMESLAKRLPVIVP